MSDDQLEVAELPLDPTKVTQVTPEKVRKRREHFVRMPWTWVERLTDAPGKTWLMAHCLLYRHWRSNGDPIKLANGMLKIDGISRRTKWRALGDLESRGLISIERRQRRSPIIRIRPDVPTLAHDACANLGS